MATVPPTRPHAQQPLTDEQLARAFEFRRKMLASGGSCFAIQVYERPQEGERGYFGRHLGEIRCLSVRSLTRIITALSARNLMSEVGSFTSLHAKPKDGASVDAAVRTLSMSAFSDKGGRQDA